MYQMAISDGKSEKAAMEEFDEALSAWVCDPNHDESVVDQGDEVAGANAFPSWPNARRRWRSTKLLTKSPTTS